MKRIVSVLLRPIAERLGALVAGSLAGLAMADPVLVSRVEAWVTAGVFLLADIIVANLKPKTQEGR